MPVLAGSCIVTAPLRAQQDPSASRPPPWLPPSASLVVPGSGQLLGGKDRGVVYLAAEAVLLTRFLIRSSEGRRERERYRDLAYAVARGAFFPDQRDTAFSYYEKLEAYVESGAFDTDPGPALVPPGDPRTYNGSIWELARRTYFPDPDSVPDSESEEYQRAIEFYRSRAVGPSYQWSWRNAGLEQDLYRRAIRSSDDAFRQATQFLGLLLANHLLSAVDGLVSERLSRNGRRIQVTTGMARDGTATWRGVVAVTFEL
jgi:hypothetical protein